MDPVRLSYLFGYTLLVSLPIAWTDIPCQYCGSRMLCTLPFNPDYAEVVNCTIACMKFDGFSDSDGSRVVIRGCSSNNTNTCEAGVELFGATGTRCSCNTQNCNQSTRVTLQASCPALAIIVIYILSFI